MRSMIASMPKTEKSTLKWKCVERSKELVRRRKRCFVVYEALRRNEGRDAAQRVSCDHTATYAGRAHGLRHVARTTALCRTAWRIPGPIVHRPMDGITNHDQAETSEGAATLTVEVKIKGQLILS